MPRLWLLLAVPALLPAQSFVKDVLPVFQAQCTGCHATQVTMGSLDLGTWEGVMKGGNHGQVVVPGKSAESRLFLMVSGQLQPAMPMGAGKLAAGELEALKRWIDAGAPKPSAQELSAAVVKAQAHIEPRVPVKAQIFSLAWSSKAGVMAAGGYKDVRLLDAKGKAVATLGGHAEVVRAVAFSADGKWIAAAGGWPGKKGEVKLWDVAKREVVRSFEGHGDSIYAVAFSPDGRTIATSSYDKLIKIWDAGSGKEIRTLKDHIDAVYALAFTPDGKRLVSGGADRTIKIWNPETGERLYTLSDPTDGVNTIALDPAGGRVAAAGLDKTIRVWSLGEKSGTLINTLIAHEDAILKLAWSPDGKTIVSASADKTIKIFNADDLAEIRTIAPQQDWVYGIEFSPEGKSFAAGRYDGSMTIYPLDRTITALR